MPSSTPAMLRLTTMSAEAGAATRPKTAAAAIRIRVRTAGQPRRGGPPGGAGDRAAPPPGRGNRRPAPAAGWREALPTSDYSVKAVGAELVPIVCTLHRDMTMTIAVK